MEKHEIFHALTALFNEGGTEVRKEIANKVAELAIEIFPDFRMTYEEKVATYNIKVENLNEAK